MGETKDSIGVRHSVKLSVCTSLSIQLIQTAAFFCRKAHACEKKWDPDALEPEQRDRFRSEHSSYVLGAIMSATMSLEAMINELFSEAGDKFKENLNSLTENQLTLLERMWDRGIPRTARYSILEKYEVFLDLIDSEQFDRGRQPYQDAKNLVALRNELVHYEPEWQVVTSETPQSQQHRLRKALRGRFEENPLTGAGNPFFPDKCLGHGCAEWALETAVSFADKFVELAGISCPFDHVRDRLNTIHEA